MRPCIFWLFVTIGYVLPAQDSVRVVFRLDPGDHPFSINSPGLRGDVPPLNWQTSLPMLPGDRYQIEVAFPASAIGQPLQFKYVEDNRVWELSGGWNRQMILPGKDTVLPVDYWDRYPPFSGNVRTLSRHAWQDDLDILEEALGALHPGLYRFQDSAALAGRFRTLRQACPEQIPLDRAFMDLCALTASVRCGHTFPNLLNQDPALQQILFNRPDKLPFTFRLVADTMVVVLHAGEEPSLEQGAIISAINGTPVAEILQRLLPFASADGSNDAKRRYTMQIGEAAEWYPFDAWFPLCFPPENGMYALDVWNNGAHSRLQVRALTVPDRRYRLKLKYAGRLPEDQEPWTYRMLNDSTALLRLATFDVWNWKTDWKRFLQERFRDMQEKKIRHLVLDIRDNEGGQDEVVDELRKYILQADIRLPETRTVLKYDKAPESIRPYISTWDSAYFDLRSRVKPDGNGFFVPKFQRPSDRVLKAGKRPFSGKIYLLTNAANSSATFLLASIFKEHGLGLIVGQATGGNQTGITGGQMFFCRLPNSGLEVDIPLIGNYPAGTRPDAGIAPDVGVHPVAADWAAGRDAVLEKVLALIAGEN